MGDIAGRVRFATCLPTYRGEYTPTILPANRCGGVAGYQNQASKTVPFETC